MKILEPDYNSPPITDQALKILDVLQDKPGEWMKRKEIALALGKRRLTPYDIELLQRLCDEKLAEIGKRPNPTPIGFEYAYRAMSED
ncbi:MAG: hypothetical protein CL610_29755 [Anaerolineaceae bacterium]|nr:hypothetical protein [Anaerolineaceae bacterium]